MVLDSETQCRKKKKENYTDRVSWLLGKYLSQPDHIRVVIELLRQIDHTICSVLLVANSSGLLQATERSHGDIAAGILCTPCFDLFFFLKISPCLDRVVCVKSYTSLLPLRCRRGYGLIDTLLKVNRYRLNSAEND